MNSRDKPSLAETHPELAAQADGWDPTTVAAGSNKKVGWRCERGHTWEDTAGHRSAGRGCPFCSNHRVLAGFNDLATTNPELATQADGWDPTTVSAGSGKKVGWKCERGHTWKSATYSRSNGTGCPVCSNRQVLVGYNDLTTTNPELATQADGWDPTTLTAGSEKKVGWKCEEDHNWISSVANRSKGSGCPVCSNNSVLPGYNDLATTNPELAAQADGWDPTTLSAGSRKKVGWRCTRGHTWNALVVDRSKGSGCPVCSNRHVLAGHNDLATTNPELAAQADGWDPTTISAGSDKKLGWKCERGHTWNSAAYSRSNGTDCPVCSNNSVLPGYNDLATTNPELAAQADGWDPTTISAGSDKKLGWKCERGHTWSSSVANRSKGSGCPVCSNNSVLPGYNDLATTNPELAAQADGWDPTTLSARSNKKVGWKCEEGHNWISSVANRSKGNGCPVCSNRKVLVAFNDLTTTNPELAAQADGWDPTTVAAGSHKKLGWKCEEGHKWNAAAYSRLNGFGCPVCSNQMVLGGYNDLATTNPELAAEADGWDPTTLTAGSGKKVGWRCERGHAWEDTAGHRSSGRGCPICSNHRVLAGFNDLATTNPELAAQAEGWDPTTVSAGSGKKVGWRCERGHTWKALVGGRSNGIGCPICSNKQVLAGYNDLATTNPELAAQADGWDPTTLTAGSEKKVGWKCDQGHTWKTFVVSRTSGYGCPSCAQTGFDPNKDGWLYLIDQDALSMFQIGISNFPENRLRKHSRRGWDVLEVRGPMEGHLAQQLETAILHAVERRGAVLGHKADIEKFDGYSEAWTKDSLKVTSIKKLLDWVYEDDRTI